MSLLCLNIDMDVIASLVLVHILAPGDRCLCGNICKRVGMYRAALQNDRLFRPVL